MGGNSFNDMLHLHYEVNWINQISSFTFKSADFYSFIFLTFKARTHQVNSDFCGFFLHQKAEVSEILYHHQIQSLHAQLRPIR